MPADRGDPALDVLFSPFESGALAWPVQGDVLFLRARHGEALQRVAAATADRLHCEQSFAPDADALRRAGWTLRDAVFPETPVADAALDTAPDAIELGRDALVLALPPRQREEARALLARAVLACAPGGTVVACMANDEGAKSGESDLRALAGLDGQASKQHCRVYWSKPSPQRTDTALLAAWRVLDAPRPVADGRFLSRPGVFAWDRIDAASVAPASSRSICTKPRHAPCASPNAICSLSPRAARCASSGAMSLRACGPATTLWFAIRRFMRRAAPTAPTSAARSSPPPRMR
jgi:16S rRNA (guanine1207-N2)-methyltransferase